MFVDLKIQNKLIREYELEIAKGIASATAVRNKLAAKYDLAYSTVHKITTNNYRIKEAKVHAKDKVSDKHLKEIEKIESGLTQKFNIKDKKTLIFASWEIRVGIDKAFLDILDQMKKEYNAEIFITSLWPDDLKYLPPELQKYNILMSDLTINSNLIFKYVPTHALCMSPLQGWEGAHDSTVILPGLIKELRTEKSHKLCKQIISTGSVGKLNAYITQYRHVKEQEHRAQFMKRWSVVQNRRGGRAYEIAKEFTKPTALIVEVKDNHTFFTRYITMEKKGTVYDLNRKFTAFTEKSIISNPEALVSGDMHSWYADEANFIALEDICRTLKPDILILNDWVDLQSINHHEWGDFAKVIQFPTLEEEAEEGKKRLRVVSGWAKNIKYLGSNHDNFLTTFLADEKKYKFGVNYKKAFELRLWQLQNPYRHPVEKLLELDDIDNLEFIPEKDSLYIGGVCVNHGHVGIAGRRVGFISLQRIFNKYVMAHTHQPQIYRNAVNVGTSSKLDMSYNIGPSAWMHAHSVIQPDDSIQLLMVINGEWRANG